MQPHVSRERPCGVHQERSGGRRAVDGAHHAPVALHTLQHGAGHSGRRRPESTAARGAAALVPPRHAGGPGGAGGHLQPVPVPPLRRRTAASAGRLPRAVQRGGGRRNTRATAASTGAPRVPSNTVGIPVRSASRRTRCTPSGAVTSAALTATWGISRSSTSTWRTGSRRSRRALGRW